MRVLFVYPDLAGDVTNYTGVTNHGIALLSGALRAAGHEPALLHLTAEPVRADLVKRVREVRPGLIAVSCNSHYARRLATWVPWLAEAGVPIAVGGVHATLAPGDVMALPGVDFVCVGEGEGAIVELCDALAAGSSPCDIPNLWTRTPEGIRRNPQRPLVEDLDSQPDPDYALFAFRELYPIRRGQFPFIMSRGCAFRCAYCGVHALREQSPRNVHFWRFLTPEKAARQLRHLLATHCPEAANVNFLDAILFPNRAWLREFAPLYRQHVGLPFSCNMRADMVDEEIASILAEMGCATVRLGVESGDEYLTAVVLDRGLTIDDLRSAFAVLRTHGIARLSYNIVGLPQENPRRALATIRLNAELDPDLALPFIFFPYPGTRLFEYCREQHILTGVEVDHYMMGVATELPGFAAGDVLFFHRFFRRLVTLYGWGRAWPARLRQRYWRSLDAVLAGPLMPRSTLARGFDRYRRARTAIGGHLVRSHPRLYRLLGGTDPG